MSSFEDCAALCGLDPDQISAVAEHEHVPEIEATAIASHLLHREGGVDDIKRMITEDVREAVARGNLPHAAELLRALRHFLRDHPHDVRA